MLLDFTHKGIKNDNNLQVVTIRILAFLGGCILALLKAVCSLSKPGELSQSES